MRQLLLGASLLALLPGAAGARGRPIVPPPKLLDISAVREQLDVFTDGKGHYFATRLPPAFRPTKVREHFYYGDGKTLYKQHLPSLGGGKTYVGASIYDPRVLAGIRSHFSYRDEKATFTCETRKTPLTLLTHDKGQALLKRAKVYDLYWTRKPHALARDDDGNYYYVDRLRSPGHTVRGYRGFRIFVGPRGKLKQVKMKNVISDVRGEIFITKKGKLRLILTNTGPSAKPEKAAWLTGRKNRKRTELTIVPVRNLRTRVMIYGDLGVYRGMRLHKPCDDL